MRLLPRLQGFTFIELLVTLSLLGIVASMAVPITLTWLDNAKITETQSQLQNAIEMARSEALRNPNGVTQNEPVAVICREAFDGQQKLMVKLVSNTPAGLQAPCGSESTKLWEIALKQGVAVTYEDANETVKPLSYLMFDTHGALLANNCPEHGACPVEPNFKVAAGRGQDLLINSI